MATHYRQAGISTPSGYFFARDGIAAEGNVNREQMVISDVDLDLLDEQRVNGMVIPLKDMIRDAYDRVIHYSDLRSAGVVAEPVPLVKSSAGFIWAALKPWIPPKPV